MNGLTREEVKRFVFLCGGEEGARRMLAQMKLPPDWVDAKHGDVTVGQNEALLNIVGDHLPALLSGEETVQFVKAVIVAFDRNARRIPPRGMKSAVCEPSRNFFLANPTDINYAERLAGAAGFFRQVFGKDAAFCTPDEYRLGCEAAMEEIRNNPAIANLANGPAFPIVLPKLSKKLAKKQNLGRLVEKLAAVAKLAYEENFQGRTFTNHRAGDLAGKVEVFPGSRQDDLLAMMAGGPVVGQQFFPLQGFSIDADREQAATLPEKMFMLSGLEIIVAWAFWPDILLKDNTTISYDLAGLVWGSADYSLCGYALDTDADFGNTDDLANADDYCSGGLFFPSAVRK